MSSAPFDSPFKADLSLAAATKHVTTTTDSNIFHPEVNKIVTAGTVRRKKYWVVCDGRGDLYYRLIDDPVKTLERLDKLRKKGLITEADYEQAKVKLLGQL